MTLNNYVRHTLTLVALLSLLPFALAGCNSSAVREPADNTINIIPDGGTITGCSQPGFPDEQPDISPLAPPVFVTEDGETERLVRPGQELRAAITVNGATKQVFVEVRDAWADQVILTDQLETPGNQTIPVLFVTDAATRGRFYMRLTLCGSDCDEREVVFDINPDINSDYERTLIEDGEVIQVDRTCVRPNSILIQ